MTGDGIDEGKVIWCELLVTIWAYSIGLVMMSHNNNNIIEHCL